MFVEGSQLLLKIFENLLIFNSLLTPTILQITYFIPPFDQGKQLRVAPIQELVLIGIFLRFHFHEPIDIELPDKRGVIVVLKDLGQESLRKLWHITH